MSRILELKELSKNYKEHRAVDKLSFQLKKGHILGLLGPNGAGKSTTINMISTILQPDSGEILYNGEPVSQNHDTYKSNIGVVPQDLAIYEDISAYENLKFFAEISGVKKDEIKGACQDALEFVALEKAQYKKPSTFSGGMKRRLNIACCLVHSPKIILMDEPTVGVDPQSRNYILQSIKQLKNQGVSVIYSTHYMEEIELIADDVVIMDKGRVIADDTLEGLREAYKDASKIKVEYSGEITPDTMNGLQNMKEVKDIAIQGSEIEVAVTGSSDQYDYNRILKYMIEKKISIRKVTVEDENLENVFLKLTGTKLRD